MKNNYVITNYTKRKAKKLGVSVKLSTVKNKKIDVYKNGKKIVSIGALGFFDFPTFVKKCGKKYANTRKKLYKNRHNKDRKKYGTPGFYASRLLW